MKLVSLIKTSMFNAYDRVWVWYLRQREKKKFKNKKRVEIHSRITLSEVQKQEIDSLYLNNYGKKIPYIWHRHYMAYTGLFDAKVIPELIYIPEFERYMNLWPQYIKVYEDKNVLPYIAANANVRTPKCVVSCTKGMFRKENQESISRDEVKRMLNNIGEVFCKPTSGYNSGQGCFLANIQDGIDCISGLDIESIFDKLKKMDFTIQKRLKCHESIRKIYAESVNTLRVISYRWKDEIKFFPIIMRIGRNGNVLDNAHAGGMFIAVDKEGTLHEKAFTEFNDSFLKHPDTALVFSGYKIEGVPKVLSATKIMHTMIPQIGCVNWDFTVDESGEAVLIEANIQGGSVWLSEMAHGIGPFGEDTEEVLRWMQLMRKTPASDRYKYAFGKME